MAVVVVPQLVSRDESVARRARKIALRIACLQLNLRGCVRRAGWPHTPTTSRVKGEGNPLPAANFAEHAGHSTPRNDPLRLLRCQYRPVLNQKVDGLDRQICGISMPEVTWVAGPCPSLSTVTADLNCLINKCATRLPRGACAGRGRRRGSFLVEALWERRRLPGPSKGGGCNCRRRAARPREAGSTLAGAHPYCIRCTAGSRRVRSRCRGLWRCGQSAQASPHRSHCGRLRVHCRVRCKLAASSCWRAATLARTDSTSAASCSTWARAWDSAASWVSVRSRLAYSSLSRRSASAVAN